MPGIDPVCPKCNAAMPGLAFRLTEGERLGPFKEVTFFCPSCHVFLSVSLISGENAETLARLNEGFLP